MSRDPHAGQDGRYHIRSLYFDDFKNTALFEKQAGVARRQKYRMRIYDYSDSVIKLEKKVKLDQYIGKESVGLTRETADQILTGDIASLAGQCCLVCDQPRDQPSSSAPRGGPRNANEGAPDDRQ